MDDPISYASFSTDVTFVRGGTLERFLHDPALSKTLRPGSEWFWVYEPTEHMVDLHCDDCAKRHNPKNLNCSGSIGSRSAAQDMNKLYKFHEIGNKAEARVPRCLNYIDYGRKTAIRGCIVSVRL